ncbi:hypothetical protein FHR90_001266 [Endobacter medicaginis]|jgi:hypothetical protein|uniref:Uncharacterized protein n=1 Tax=Endobacter medicaginis TaxID=1181271 RepID=A0A839UYK9_9PROT|nr:hypothetical protein [Endobacter medicaginis]MBB3173443.1 hypothetical protein [Endobacter medicaginis]MCX5475522.1 hypothetical protein [Endobacter medicaginis]NVN30167.1 hypothetical protein [Endobacter medicaginis]
MRNKLILPCAALAGVIASAAFAVTMRDNEVFFDVAGVQAFSFQEAGHSIHSKQPWGGVSADVSRPGGQGRILVKAGRKASSFVAAWFKSAVGAGQTLVCDSRGTFPDELNFAVRGTLRFTAGGRAFTCNDFVVGQGHFATANNWWLGSPKMSGTHVSLSGATAQLCTTPIAGHDIPVPVTFAPQTPCSNHFSISPILPK